MPTRWGGSNVDPKFGAQVWVNNFLPLQEEGIRVGIPSMSASRDGITWLKQFLGNCSQLNAGQPCTYDFVPLHWYGDLEGMASHIGEYVATYVYDKLAVWH